MNYSIEKNYVRMNHPGGGKHKNVFQDWFDLIRDPAFSKRMNCLIDLSSLPKPMKSEDVKIIATDFETLKEKIGPRLSFIVKSQLDYGMVRMFGSLVEMRGFDIKIFDAEEKAIAWLME